MDWVAIRNSNLIMMIPAIAMIIGEAIYFYGLWDARLDHIEKGFFFAVLALGMFAAVSLQKTLRDRDENIPTTNLFHGICVMMLFIAVALFIFGVWNARVMVNEKGLFCLAYIFSVYGAVFAQKRVRDEEPV